MEESVAVVQVIQSITAQFEVIMGSPDQVEADCHKLRQYLSQSPKTSDILQLQKLLPLLRNRAGALTAPVFSLLEEVAATSANPWSWLEGLLAARDIDLVHRALELTGRLADSGALAVDVDVVRSIAERVEVEGNPLSEYKALRKIAGIVRHLSVTAERPVADPVLHLYLNGEDAQLRRLAARLLDLDEQPASPDVAKQVLGADAEMFLASYLAYTRATQLDLLSLVPRPGTPPPLLASLQHAEGVCGEKVLRDVIAALGWGRINLGLEVRRYVSLSFNGSLPLMLSPTEAQLLEGCTETRYNAEYYLFFAHGGTANDSQPLPLDSDPVARFRAYNLTHASVLAEILDMAPLNREKVHRILSQMDQIVRDFTVLFASHTEECTILPALYQELKQKILFELDREPEQPQLSAELTRLVQMFEDPRALGEVHTLHGLKRYLHQQGLRLGFRLVDVSRVPNRTLDLVLASPQRVLLKVERIRYADFEPAETVQESNEASHILNIPYPVKVVADGFAKQLLYGQESFPRVDIFCYGNEVHYYLGFRNHPAFLRIDYAPPLQGGMIDLEYYGVSKYELEAHPDLSLQATRLFFQHLEFDTHIENTRIHARYDKERARDLGDLCEKVEAIFRLVPYFLEIDWVIGSLKLDAEARGIVAENWAKSFTWWGVLPLRDLLTEDRQGIREPVPAGTWHESEVVWSGKGPYRDRFSITPSADFFNKLRAQLEELSLEEIPYLEETGPCPLGQLHLEQRLLAVLRQAVARGELLDTAEGFRPTSPTLFQREHEAERVAEWLASGNDALASALVLGQLVALLERTLDFRTSGSVEEYDVQAALLPLRGQWLSLYVLRDRKGIIRLAFFARDRVLFRSRNDPSAPWVSNACSNPIELASRLRRSNYLVSIPSLSAEKIREEVGRLRKLFRSAKQPRRDTPLPGERIITGLRAAVGRAVGRVLFGTQGRRPEDFDDAVLVAPTVSPEDNTFLYHAAGIVSTGGGILSHAGLIATQFHKPSLIISGQWQPERDGSLILRYVTTEYREEERDVRGYCVRIRQDVRQRRHDLREGDLVVVDAGEGTLRVLGQERDTLALHEAFRQFGHISRCLAQTTAERELLVLRGRWLRARYQIEKLLKRMTDPALACYAVDELLLSDLVSDQDARRNERAHLLTLILQHHGVGEPAREHVRRSIGQLEDRYRRQLQKANESFPQSPFVYEILLVRLELLRLHQALQGATESLQGCGIAEIFEAADDLISINQLAQRRLEELRQEIATTVSQLAAGSPIDGRCRHLLLQWERADLLLGRFDEQQEQFDRVRAQLAQSDMAVRQRLESFYILGPGDGGLELLPLIGGKAANLAEVERLAGAGVVPPWFVITDRAFQDVLDSSIYHPVSAAENRPDEASTLRAAIEAILARPDLSQAQQSVCIRDLWESVTLPTQLIEDVMAAYHRIGAQGDDATSEPFVSTRSSAIEEDVEVAARAGEFETFLFIQGEQALLDHLKRTWSGLWTERAIHNRAVMGIGVGQAGGGVIVQRMVCSRVSGVLQTINVAGGDLREMVINAGWGLGEGIVSGTVAADQITVAKEGDLLNGPLRFTSITADKKEQVVFNRRRGLGTIRTETLSHQRFRPALEYLDLCQLVSLAARLEIAYGYPLDIEFAIEGTQLWILQVRPVAVFLPALQETLDRYPLAKDIRRWLPVPDVRSRVPDVLKERPS